MEQDPRAQGAAEPSVHHRPYATPASYDAAISHCPHVAAPSHEMIPAPAPHPGSHPEPSQHAASGQASAAKPVGRLGTTCRAVYCQGEDARITKANPGVDVPKKDIARRGAFLMRIWQSCVGDNSPQLHERVQKDLAEAARRLEVIKQKKANGERVNPTDYPSRIRIHRSHFPPGSFEKSNDRRLTCDADRMKDTALPFNYLEYRSWKQQQAPELQGWSNGPEGQQPPAPLLEGERTDANQADNAAKRYDTVLLFGRVYDAYIHVKIALPDV